MVQFIRSYLGFKCRAATSVLLVAVLSGLVDAGDDDDYKNASKACIVFFPKPVQTLCYENFPPKESEKLWLVLFTSHDCFHCQLVKKHFLELASRLQDDPGVAVGAVNCYYQANYNALCRKRKVDNLPSLRIIEKGVHNLTDKKVDSQYPRHTKEDIDRLVKAALEPRPPCPRHSSHKDGAAILPLCKASFPSTGNVETTWLVIFYSSASTQAGELINVADGVATQLGNTANLEELDAWKRLKKRDRLQAIGAEYSLQLALPADGPFGYTSLAKVGGVCCDCDAEQEDFCTSMLGGGEAPTLPLAAWIVDGQQVTVESILSTRSSLMEFALANLDFLAGDDEL